jgi:hypothetical protein
LRDHRRAGRRNPASRTQIVMSPESESVSVVGR